jgi:hypothetical protein
MSDREKVINDLQMQIEELEERLAIVLEGQPEIVRCKDCKRYYANGGNCDQVLADWFCADGERR